MDTINWADFRLGTVVKSLVAPARPLGDEPYVGHIVGFKQVHYDTGFIIIPKVMWSDGTTSGIHPTAIELM